MSKAKRTRRWISIISATAVALMIAAPPLNTGDARVLGPEGITARPVPMQNTDNQNVIESKNDGSNLGDQPMIPWPEPGGVNELAERYAPAVILYNMGSHGPELYGPTNVDYFLQHSELKWVTGGYRSSTKPVCSDNPQCEERNGHVDGHWARGTGCDIPPPEPPPDSYPIDRIKLGALGNSYRRDANGTRHYTALGNENPWRDHGRRDAMGHGIVPHSGFVLDVIDSCHRLPASDTQPIYYDWWMTYELSRNPPFLGTYYIYIRYWMLFIYDELDQQGNEGWCDQPSGCAHEGDWEGIRIKFTEGGSPKRVRFFMHNTHLDLDWDEITVWPNGLKPDLIHRPTETHLISYNARNSHGNYPDSGDPITGRHVVDVTGPDISDYTVPRNLGVAWRTWAHGVYDVRDRTSQQWAWYTGEWGTVGGTEDNGGPVGPRFQRPSKGSDRFSDLPPVP